MAKGANLKHHLSLSESVGLRLLLKMFVGSIRTLMTLPLGAIVGHT